MEPSILAADRHLLKQKVCASAPQSAFSCFPAALHKSISGLMMSLITLHSREVPPRPRHISMPVFAVALRKLTPHWSMVLTTALQPRAMALHVRTQCFSGRLAMSS
jgi:hypothetical protein